MHEIQRNIQENSLKTVISQTVMVVKQGALNEA